MHQGKKVVAPLAYNETKILSNNEMEEAYRFDQAQLTNAKIFNLRCEYAKTLNKNISYLEVGVGWGHSAQMFIDQTEAISADLLDLYNNAEHVGNPGLIPELGSMTHEEHIKNKFAAYTNINTIKGDARDILPTLNKKYDFIYLDMEEERFLIRDFLLQCSKLLNDGGVIGLTSYANYNPIYNKNIGIFQSVNEFLYFNKDWSIDAIALHDLALHDIYIKKNNTK